MTEELNAVGLADFRILIENIDPIFFNATGAKANGTLSLFQPALHFEFPRVLRDEPLRDQTITFLINGLTRVVRDVF